MKNITKDFFKANRKRLKNSVGDVFPIIVTGNGLVRRSKDDDAFPFHQDADFWYLSGLNEPELTLVIDEHEEYLILPERDERFVIFSGQFNVDELKNTSGIANFLDQKSGWEKLTSRLKNSSKIASIKPAAGYSETYYIYTNPNIAAVYKKIKAINKKIKLVDIKSNITSLRVIKSAPEIKAISGAISHTNNVLKIINKNFNQYNSENNIESEIIKYQIDNQLGSAFNPIVANGKNSCTLHYQKNNQKINSKKVTLIDTGYISEGYCSDVTRVISKNPTKRQVQVHQAVIDIQDYAFSIIKPGILPLDYERKVALFAGEKLKELGLIKVINHENIYQFFKHRTSHFLGVDCHDDGNYDNPFDENMVITVEPGIYIEKEDIGVRIEDNVLITKSGIKNLTKSVSRNLN